MIITKTPFRVSFCGGGSDMANFYEKYGGCVLSKSHQQQIFREEQDLALQVHLL